MGKYPQPIQQKNNRGQLLIEVMIAIFLVTAALLTYFGLMIKSLSLNTIIADNYTAVYLASEGIEVVKNVIDSNYAKNPESPIWNEGIENGENWKIAYNSTTANEMFINEYLVLDNRGEFYINESRTPCDGCFQRKINIEQVDHNGDEFPDEIEVTSTVSWESKGKPMSVILEDHFYNWR